MTDTPDANYRGCVERGRVLVERYAEESPELKGTRAYGTAAGDLIGDVLAYTASLHDPLSPRRTSQVERFARVAADGVKDALRQLASSGPGDLDIPTSEQVRAATVTFAARLEDA